MQDEESPKKSDGISPEKFEHVDDVDGDFNGPVPTFRSGGGDAQFQTGGGLQFKGRMGL